MGTAHWIAVDWGTSNLRVWVFDRNDRQLAFLTSDKGMGTLTQDQFEPVLLGLIDPYLGQGTTPVICCGMVGARQGWSEADYAKAPCPAPDALSAHRVPDTDPRIAVHILPGVAQQSPPDVMRGEETQIAGFLAENKDFYGTICLPGTHTKWVQISAEEIVSFRTFMTGEMFSLLAKSSVLRHSVGSTGWDNDAFLTAVSDAMGSPQQVGSRLFALRADGLLNGTGSDIARSRLSGMLIGLELAGAKGYWLGQEVCLIGDPALNALYEQSLNAQGVPTRNLGGSDLTLAGLKAAHRVLKDDQT